MLTTLFCTIFVRVHRGIHEVKEPVAQSHGAAADSDSMRAVGGGYAESLVQGHVSAEDEEDEAPLVRKPFSGAKAEAKGSTPNAAEKLFAARKSRTSIDNEAKARNPNDTVTMVKDHVQMSTILTESAQKGFQHSLEGLECLSFLRKRLLPVAISVMVCMNSSCLVIRCWRSGVALSERTEESCCNVVGPCASRWYWTG